MNMNIKTKKQKKAKKQFFLSTFEMENILKNTNI